MSQTPRPFSLPAEIAGWYGTAAILAAYALSSFRVLGTGAQVANRHPGPPLDEETRALPSGARQADHQNLFFFEIHLTSPRLSELQRAQANDRKYD